MTNWQRRYIGLDDGRISYLACDRAGPGAPVLHFAHATGLNAGTYVPLLDTLADRFRIRAWDARGHGFTELPADPDRLGTWEQYVTDMARFLDALGEGAPVLLAGHSMGATASIELCATRPDLACGIVAVDPPLVAPAHARVLSAMRGFGMMREPEIARRAARRRGEWPDRETVRTAYRGRGAFQSWPDPWLDGYLDGGLVEGPEGGLRLACTPAWEAATFRGVSTRIWARFAILSRPMTLLKATINSTVAPDSPAAIARLAPHVVQRTVEGASHFLPMEHPDIVASEINDMADRIGLPR